MHLIKKISRYNLSFMPAFYFFASLKLLFSRYHIQIYSAFDCNWFYFIFIAAAKKKANALAESHHISTFKINCKNS